MDFLASFGFTVITKEKGFQLKFGKKFENFLYVGLYKDMCVCTHDM